MPFWFYEVVKFAWFYGVPKDRATWMLSMEKNVGNPYLNCFTKLSFNWYPQYTEFYSLSSEYDDFKPKHMQPVLFTQVPSLIEE